MQQLQKVYTCFTCGKQIVFTNKEGRTEYIKGKFGKMTLKRFNLDGSFHVCEKKETNNNTSSGYNHYRSSRKSTNYWKWFYGFGPGRYHNKNKERYSSDEYEQRRKAAQEQRERWRENFSRNASIQVEEALRRLELGLEVLQKDFEEKLKIIKTAYRKLALRFHPDRVPEAEKAAAHTKFIEITEAYEVLTK